MSDAMSVIRAAGLQPHRPLPFVRWADEHLLAWHRLFTAAVSGLDQLTDAARVVPQGRRSPAAPWDDIAALADGLARRADALDDLRTQAVALGDPFRGAAALSADATSRHALATDELLGWYDDLRVWAGPGHVSTHARHNAEPQPPGFAHVAAIAWADPAFRFGRLSRAELWRRCGTAARHGGWLRVDSRLRKPIREQVAEELGCAAGDATDLIRWMYAWTGFTAKFTEYEPSMLANELADARERLARELAVAPRQSHATADRADPLLTGWRQIITVINRGRADDVKLRNNEAGRRWVRTQHEHTPSPITFPGRGGQPRVREAALLAWLDRLGDGSRKVVKGHEGSQ